MRRISRLRFDALAGYIRDPRSALISEEIAWYSDACERVLGVVLRDTVDNDFVSIVLGRDERQCFRAIEVESSLTLAQSRRTTLDAISKWSTRPDVDFFQDVEVGPPVDFFQPIVPLERLGPTFRLVRESVAYSPARDIIAAMMYYFKDPDGNFVEQFQTTGFDSRVWELYIFAALHELGYAFDRHFPAPDFLCQGLRGTFFVEAVTVNSTIQNGANIETGLPDDIEARERYLSEYMPIKYGSALYSKLNRRYWELPHVAGHPIVLAIQDFHFPRSMAWSEPSLAPYLYGRRFTARHDEGGRLVIKSDVVQEHRWGQKVIPSGFFRQPGAEHISAVLTNAQGTISKFNRLGYLAGFGSRLVEMVRTGTRYVHDPNAALPQGFMQRVNDSDYQETWVEGMNVYHNPRALVRLNPALLPAAAHHTLRNDGMMGSSIPEFHPYGSETMISASRIA